MVPVLGSLIPLLASALVALPTAAPAPVAPAARRSCSIPGQALDLTNWKLTLPIGSAGRPTEVSQPQLASYRHAQYFYANPGCDGATFAAPVGGVTTSGSKYPRSELREMVNGGRTNASWSSTSGTHRITVTESFTRLPAVKPHLVGLQIHDALDDVSTFRLEGTKLWITNGDNSNFYLVTANYRLGTRFTAGYEVARGQVKAYYNGRNVVSFLATFTGGYFKAGAYTQANCINSTPCTTGNYGATALYSAVVSHSAAPAASARTQAGATPSTTAGTTPSPAPGPAPASGNTSGASGTASGGTGAASGGTGAAGSGVSGNPPGPTSGSSTDTSTR